jgi:hypothetical protein
VLRLFAPDVDPETIPEKARRPRQSEAVGDGRLSGDEITVRIMQGKGLDPIVDRKLRTDFLRRILQSLDALERRYERVKKTGSVGAV